MDLTDESDPLFLYSMTCSEQDYHILKAEQSLLVDFQAFPQSFVELLQFCQSMEEAASSGMSSNSYSQNKFIAVFNSS